MFLLRNYRPFARLLTLLLLAALPTARAGWAAPGQVNASPGPTVEQSLAEARTCQTRFQRAAAAAAYDRVLRLAPNHFEALWNRAVLAVQLTFGQTDKAAQREAFRLAGTLAERALRLDSARYEAHFAVALAAGAAQRGGSPAERLAAGRAVRWHAGRALALNPRHAESWALLGSWHLGLANLNWAERLVAGTATAGASNEEARRCFQQALRWQPDNLKYYLLSATACQHLGRRAEGQALLHQALHLPPLRPEDPQVRQKCTALLHELS